MSNVNDCSCDGGIKYGIVQCCSCKASGNLTEITQKRIWNNVGVSESEYIMNRISLEIYEKPSKTYNNVNWNQSSDRALPANSDVSHMRIVPSHGNSTKTSITRARPGACAPGEYGVDIKHGSYARYLARLKGKGPLRTQQVSAPTPLMGNKTKSYGIVNSKKCLCFTR